MSISKVHDFYCTNCGHKHKAEDICFNLLEILDWNLKRVSIDFVPFGEDDIKELMVKNNVGSCDEEFTELRMSLDVFMSILSRIGEENPNGDKERKEMLVQDFLEGENWPFRIKNQTMDSTSGEGTKLKTLAGILADKFCDAQEVSLKNGVTTRKKTLLQIKQDLDDLKTRKEKLGGLVEADGALDIIQKDRLREEIDNLEKSVEKQDRKTGDLLKEEDGLERAIEAYRDVEVRKIPTEDMNLAQYGVTLYLKIKYINSTKSEKKIIDTIEFKQKKEDTVGKRCRHMMECVRGYCKDCYAPIIDGAGQYPHYLVGFLGQQDAGKTSLFVSLSNMVRDTSDEESNIRKSLGITCATLLADGQYKNLYEAIRTYEKGWLIGKTDAGEMNKTKNYNVNLKIEMENNICCFLTFVDVAGERYFDKVQGTINEKAFNESPLLQNCHLYVYCTCLDDGHIDGILNMQQYTSIIDGIFAVKNQPVPLCLVIGKCDQLLEESNNDNESGVSRKYTLKEKIPNLQEQKDLEIWEVLLQSLASRDIDNTDIYEFNVKDDLEYAYKLLSNFSTIKIKSRNYEKDKENWEGLKKILKDMYNWYEPKTYMSLIACSALGAVAKKTKKIDIQNGDNLDEASETTEISIEVTETSEVNTDSRYEMIKQEWAIFRRGIEACPQKTDEEGNKIIFQPDRISHVMDWILKTLGIREIYNGNRFDYIPILGESYKLYETDKDNTNGVWTRYLYNDINVIKMRINNVMNIYLNASHHDLKLNQIIKDYELNRDNSSAGLNLVQEVFHRLVGKKRQENDVNKEIITCINEWLRSE